MHVLKHKRLMENENSGMITMHRNYTRESRDINKVKVHQIRVKSIFYSTSQKKKKKTRGEWS